MAFLVDPDELANCEPGSTVAVSGAEGRHGAVVRRLEPGEQVQLVDGRGLRASGSVVAVSRDGFDVQLTEVVVEPEATPRLTVVQALAKGDRSQLAVEMLTEVGVDRIIPWQAERSVVRWRGERAAKGTGRWLAAAESATKQSRRARVPEVPGLADLSAVVNLVSEADLAIVLHETGGARLANIALPNRGEICLVIGPEGGISPDEIAALGSAGALVARLGESVLRTSTAGVVAAGIVMARSGRWD